MSDFKDKIKSIATPRRMGQSERWVETAKGASVIHEEHWDGRVDAAVQPTPVRLHARVHNSGSQKGRTAEVRELSDRERRERYGDSR